MRPYFELGHVREGIFYVANKLYGITFTEIKDIPKPDLTLSLSSARIKMVRIWACCIWISLPARGKGGGAWCGGYRSQTYKDGETGSPVVTTVFNFSKPAEGQPALLTADETETVFHEFGHALHGLFCDVHYMACPTCLVTLWSYLRKSMSIGPLSRRY